MGAFAELDRRQSDREILSRSMQIDAVEKIIPTNAGELTESDLIYMRLSGPEKFKRIHARILDFFTQ